MTAHHREPVSAAALPCASKLADAGQELRKLKWRVGEDRDEAVARAATMPWAHLIAAPQVYFYGNHWIFVCRKQP